MAPDPVPAGWSHRRLVDLFDLPSGQVDPRRLPYRKQVLVAPDHIESATGRLIAVATAEAQGAISGKYVFARGDVVYSKIRPYLRKAIKADFDGLCSADMYPLRPKGDTEPGFLLALILGESFSKFAESVSMRSGFPKINREELAEYKAIVPPGPEQARIAEVLDTVDEAIRTTEQVIAKLELVKRGLLQDLLTRGIGDNGEIRDPERHPEQFKDSPLGRIPKKWTTQTVLDSAAPEPGATTIGPFGSNLVASDYRESGVPVVFVRDIKEGEFEWKSDVYVSEQKARALAAHLVRPGDVVATKMGLPPGIAAVYPSSMPAAVITADVVRVRPSHLVRASWLAVSLNSERSRAQIRAITGGVTRPKITLADFRGIRIAVPQVDEQVCMEVRFMEMRRKLAVERSELEKLRLLKKGLMDDLLTGRVRTLIDSRIA